MTKADTTTKILEAAGPIFASKGFEAATVRDICQAARVNVASVNYHFGDKETLYLETVRFAHRLRVQQVPHADYDESAPAEEKLRAFVKTMLSRVLGVNALPWQAQLMMREVLNPTDACRDMVESYIRPEVEQLQRIMAPLLPADIRRADRMKVAFSIIGQCLFYRFAGNIVAMLTAGQSRSHYEIETLCDHICRFSLAALDGLAKTSASGSPATKRKRRTTANPSAN